MIGDNWFIFHLLSAGDLFSVKKANAHFSDDLLSTLFNEPIPGHGVFWSSAGGKSYPIPLRVLSFEQAYSARDPKYGMPTAKTFAIICDDPDAPSGTWVHWVLYNLPADRIGLVENVPATEKVPGDGLQSTNDFQKIGYGGPCPPSGTHHYFFKLYALDGELSLQAGATKAELLKAMEGHTLAQTQLMGTYRR